jgi:fructose-specific phosphotransferase system component IIB
MTGTEQADLHVKDALDRARVSAQELHRALTDAAARHGGALKADLDALPGQARTLEHTVRHSLEAQNAITRHYIDQAATYLHATHMRIDEALKSSGAAAEGLIQSAISDARESLQNISEAIAARRSHHAASTK